MKNLWVLIGSILATELTFELKENDEQCFFEEVNKGDNSNIEFEVRKSPSSARPRSTGPNDPAAHPPTGGRTEGRNRLIDLFQVVTGGHLDIDVKLYSPDSNVIFEVSFRYSFKSYPPYRVANPLVETTKI